ncbi:hypothetical protein ABRQ03_01225 [Pectobacterium jejuense]|uniref:hypothetical protein n=1 Tax=Pectobacterium jejuense TaxID=2974022 RepID=UPI0032ED73ED
MGNGNWAKKNWLGLIGLIIGLLGLGSSYYFYTVSVKEKEPILLEDPLRSTIVEADSIKNFPLRIVDRAGNPVEKDITALRFYLWNQGRESIKNIDILKPIRVKLASQDVQIIDYQIVATSRPEIVNPKINLTAGTSNMLNIDFDILEEGDGLAVQLLYAGSRNSELSIEGVIEGVSKIQSNSSLSSYHFYKSIFIIIVLPLGITAAVMSLTFLIRPTAVKTLIPALGFLAEDMQGKGKYFRALFALVILIPMIIVPIRIYKEEKTKIEKRAYESMLNIIPSSISAIPSQATRP